VIRTKLEKLVSLNIERSHKQIKEKGVESLIGVVGPWEISKREKCHLFFFKVGD